MRIRESALHLFAARNFSTVTIKDIANETGLNTALIYYYFGSKEELFRSAIALAVDQAFTAFRANSAGPGPPDRIILDWLDTHVRAYDSISKLIKLAIDYSSTAERTVTIDRAISRFYDEEREVLRAALTSGVRSGLFPKVDPDAMATFVSTYLDGIFVRAMMLRDFDPLLAISDLKQLVCEQLGIRARARRRVR